MPSIPFPVVEAIRRQHGLVTTEQLIAAGVRRHGRARLVRDGYLLPGPQGVYRSSTHDRSLEQECLAACLTADDVVISGPSAGQLLRLRKMPTGSVHVMSERRVHLDGVTAHRTTSLPSSDVVRRPDGIRLLRPARLVTDLAHHLDDDDLESVIEQLLDRRSLTMPALLETARRLRRSGRDGSVRLARVLDRRPAWLRPKDSDLEVRFLRALETRGVDLEPQVRLEVDGGVLLLDAADRPTRFGLEIDHVTWHGGRLDSQRDKWRDRQAARIGWLVTRVTDDDLRRRFNATVDDVVAIHRLRAA